MNIDQREIGPITNVLGLAVLDSQRLEFLIAFMMLLVHNELSFSDREIDKKIDDYMLDLSKKTLGVLIGRLKKLIIVSDGFSEKLEEALDARNYLMHKSINQNSNDLLTKEGRKEILFIVKNKREILNECNFFLDPIIDTLLKLRETSPDFLNREITEKFMREENK